MRIPFDYDGYAYLSDDTQQIDPQTLFLKTAQNSRYFDALDPKPPLITPRELARVWGLDALRTVGITGTNGKTTTAALVYSFLNDLGVPAALQGTRGFFIHDRRMDEKSMTTPSVLETMHNMHRAREAGCTHFVMEVSSHAIDQERIEGIDFALKIHTNVTSDHLDYHGTVEEYRRVKSRFFADESPKLLNKDAITHLEYNPKNAYTYGVDAPATFGIIAYTLKGGITAGVRYFDEEATFHSPLMGFFNLFNLLAAVAAVKILTQKPLQEVCDAVEGFGGVSGRMEVVSRDPMVIVDFAHTEDGIVNVLQSLRDQDIVVVFGAGGDRDRTKRPRMGAAVGRFANRIYVTSDNPRSEDPQTINDEILEGLRGKANVTSIVDRREAIETAIASLHPDEVLVILGKGDEEYQEIDGVKHPFDDRVVVRETLARIRGR
jgi:UDP-N-acetylmuramoyl-L-alanyl-D-glutamate--2,6-diaminopimelate ligase